MDVSRLLSPCPGLHVPLPVQPTSHESIQPTERVKTEAGETIIVSTSPRHQQKRITSTKTTSIGRLTQTLAACEKRTADSMNKPHAQFPVKRKRKRRFSAQQKQVMRENEEDDSRIYNLTLDINELKRQVHDLLMRKCVFETRELAQKKVLGARVLVTKQLYNVAVLRTTQRFFEIFRTGYRDWEPEEDAFLAATIDRDISIASGVRGADAFFEQWLRYTTLLQVRFEDTPSIRILVSDAESCVVECMGELNCKLTLPAIKAMFPHVLQGPELLRKVVDCRLICPTHTLLYFDANGRIVQYDANVDFYAGWNRLLPTNPMDVIMLMSNGRVNLEGSTMIPDLNEERATKIINDDLMEWEAGTKENGLALPSPVGSTTTSLLVSVPSSSSSCSSRSSMGYILS